MSGKTAQTDEKVASRLDKLAFWEQLEELRTRGLKDTEEAPKIRRVVKALLQPGGPKRKIRDEAEIRRLEVEAFFKSRDFAITVPKLELSNTQLRDLRKAGKEPEYRPSDAEVPYDAFMVSVGQGNHWTVTEYKKYKAGETSTIDWEPCTQGYWFIAEVKPSCPRTGTSWNDLTADTSIRLLSLEEYVITWWERKSQGITMDIPTWCWLRTRYNKTGAFRAGVYRGKVPVYFHDAELLAGPLSDGGGRSAEGVKAVA